MGRISFKKKETAAIIKENTPLLSLSDQRRVVNALLDRAIKKKDVQAMRYLCEHFIPKQKGRYLQIDSLNVENPASMITDLFKKYTAAEITDEDAKAPLSVLEEVSKISEKMTQASVSVLFERISSLEEAFIQLIDNQLKKNEGEKNNDRKKEQ